MFLFFVNAVQCSDSQTFNFDLPPHCTLGNCKLLYTDFFFFRKKSARIKERKQKVKRKSEKSQSHLKRFVDYYVTVVEETCSESWQTSKRETMVL